MTNLLSVDNLSATITDGDGNCRRALRDVSFVLAGLSAKDTAQTTRQKPATTKAQVPPPPFCRRANAAAKMLRLCSFCRLADSHRRINKSISRIGKRVDNDKHKTDYYQIRDYQRRIGAGYRFQK